MNTEQHNNTRLIIATTILQGMYASSDEYGNVVTMSEHALQQADVLLMEHDRTKKAEE